MSVSSVEAPSFPVRRTCPYQPPDVYREISERGPINKVTLWDGRQVWLITGYEEGRRLLADERLSSDRSYDEYPTMAPHLGAPAARKLVLVGEDPPLHNHHRRLLNPEFSLKHARALRPDIERIVNGLIDGIEEIGAPADLVEHFAAPIPSLVMSALLGIPYEDHAFFQSATAGIMQGKDQAGTEAAAAELVRYLDRLVTAQEEERGESLVGRLVEHVDTGELSHDEVVQLTMVLLIAGLETTSSMIPLGVLALLDHPEQLAALRSGEVPAVTAIEELLRITAVTDFAGVRWITADIEIDGHVLKAGDGLVISSTMVNRDERVHEDPYAFDISRGSRQHVTFGYGIHQCLGQNLARLQLEVAFETLVRRLPGLRLAVPAEELRMRRTGTMQSVERLPVAW
ncbi:cytochrome P450 [Kitasatospora sp. NBC_00240]|uniref:cytochrome P450 n=1 Tax=Kitasatospora sp. NBC_00240 TaxID=2903567 RepID=UPI0022550ACE|nr:cytochrome P450 [Kitasatospora sp. NBC_00240]MCX5208614.1 cytochrome P450 [Kitasatospora sp. NBC_00240]